MRQKFVELYATKPHDLEMLKELTIFFLKWEKAESSKATRAAQTKVTSDSKDAPKPAFEQMALLLFGDQRLRDSEMNTTRDVLIGQNSQTMLNVDQFNAV